MGHKKRYQFSFSKGLLAFMLTGITFTFVLVFILGFLVGKGYHQDRSVEIKTDKHDAGKIEEKDRISSKEKRDLNKVPSDLEWTFYKTLLRKEGAFYNQNDQVKKPSKTEKYREQIKQKEKEAFRKGKEKSKSLNGYTLQVGSFQNKEQAKKLAYDLRRNGYPTYIVSSNIPMKGVWHRVRVGHFRTFEEAKKFGLTIEMKERLPTYVTFISK